MELLDTGAEALVRTALVEALALEMAPSQIANEQPLYEHPIALDSLGFHRVIVELEVRRGAIFDEHALKATIFETVSDLIRFVSAQAQP